MSLRGAIEQLERELVELGNGSANQPKEESLNWYILRTRALGLSLLRKAEQLGGDRVLTTEQLYKAASKNLKAVEAPVEPS